MIIFLAVFGWLCIALILGVLSVYYWVLFWSNSNEYEISVDRSSFGALVMAIVFGIMILAGWYGVYLMAPFTVTFNSV